MLSEVVERINALAPEVEALAPSAEREGELGAELVRLLRDEGLFRLSLPASLGGSGFDVRAQIAVVSALAAADGSAAFAVAMAIAAADAMPEAVRRQIFAAHPHTIVSGSGTPTRDAVLIEGGVQITGRWPGVVGSAQADVVTVFFITGEGDAARMGHAYLPRDVLGFRRTWAAAGLRGAGSDTVVVDSVFVPADKVVWVERGADPSARVPVLSILPAAVALGLAQGVVRRATDHVRGHAWAGTSYDRAKDAASVQTRLADAVMHVDTAALHLERAARAVDDAGLGSGRLPRAVRARCRADAAWAVRNAVAATELVMSVVGLDALADDSPMERAWRDLATLSKHGAVDPLVTAEAFGRVLLDIDGGVARLPI